MCGFFSFSGFSEMEKRLIVNTKSRSYRQKLIKVDSITHGRVTAQMFYDLPSNDSDEGAIYDFTLIDSLIFLTKRCDFKVWQWSSEGWVNLYKKHNKGWCMANRYIRNRELIGFTADGFWTSQSGLYVFDNKMGSWDLLEAKNSPSDYVSSGDFKIGKDTIVSLYGKKVHLGEESHGGMMEGYGLNLNNHTWFKVSSEIDLKAKINSLVGGVVFDFEKSVYIIKESTSLFIDKATKKVYYKAIEYIEDDKIEFCYNDCMTAIIIHGGLTKVLVPEIDKEAKFLGQISFQEIEESPADFSDINIADFSWMWGGAVLLVLGFVLGLFLMTNKKLKKRTKETNLHSELIKKLVQSVEMLLSNQELDEVLEIDDDINTDSKRVKRSRIIQEVNSEYQLMAGKELITRQRDPKDKRYMLYRIKK